MPTVSETLNKAADLIEVEGFAKGVEAMCFDGPHCVEAAIQAVSTQEVHPCKNGRWNYLDPYHPAAVALKAHLDTPYSHLFMWSDHSTQEQVVTALRAAAVIAAAKEAGPLTATDLHTLAATYGGTVTESPGGTRLVGATMAGTSVDLGPVRAVSV